MTAAACRADEIVARARAWIGTPYRHRASCRGAGADCLGLVRGVWREVSVAKHVGFLARSAQGHATLIHAYSGRGVVESPLTPSRARRIAGAFRFPEGCA